MKNALSDIKQNAINLLDSADNLETLEQLRVKF